MNEGLVRVLGTRQLAASIVNATVGAGIFLVPALAAKELGAAAPLAFVVCGAAMALIVTSFAIAGSRVSSTGGIFAYAETAFGPFVGFLTGAIQWMSCVVAASGVSVALLDQLGGMAPILASRGMRAVLLAIVVGLLATINVRGTRAGARTVELLTAAKLLPLFVFVGAGVFAIEASALVWPGVPTVSTVARAALVLIFAFSGIEIALTPSGEVRDPARTVPRAIYLALALTTTLYVAVQLVVQGVLGSELVNHQAAPLVDATGRFLGSAGVTLVFAGALCSIFGYMSGDMLGSPRTLFAFGRDGVMPAALGRVHPVHHTPYVAIWVHGLLVFALASTSSFVYLALVANVASLVLYLVGCAAAIVLLRRDERVAGTRFVVPGGPMIPCAAIAVILWFLSSATWQEFAATGVVVVLASAVYLVRGAGPAPVLQADPP